MRRGGRVLIFLVLIIVILIAVAFLVIGRGMFSPAPAITNTPPVPLKGIVSVGQPIPVNGKIELEALSTLEIPSDRITEKMITDPTMAVGKYAAFPLAQGLPITLDMLRDRGDAKESGSQWATRISPGMVAVSIPINRLSAMAYGIRDHDWVNIIVTTLFVDVDSNFQSILPNNFGQVVNLGAKPDEAALVTLGMNNGGPDRTAGRAELDPVLNQAIYYIPSEVQRPRLVSQMILQNIEVLRVGDFSLTDPASAQPTPSAVAAPDQAAAPADQPPTPAVVVKPDIVTLIMTPQDAIALTYLMYSGVKFTLTLRAPDDNTRIETEAATLQYILSQYAIPVPAKLPYSVEPRLDQLKEPAMSNDGTPTPLP